MATARILDGRYELDAPLGTGGMASVYRGTDMVLGRTVAIKLLGDRFTGDDRFVTRFRREAQAAAGLNHPNVVSVYDTGDDGEAHYIVMEYVEGRTLADVLRGEGPLPPRRAVAIVEQVANALDAAHAEGLVHRDVKPGNILLTEAGGVKVADFGIALAATDETLTQTGTILGTASYVSPEQAQGKAVDARSDIYSLGCVLFEMLTGRAPFTGDSVMAIAYQHVNETPVPPSTLNNQVPSELDGVVLTAMAKDPDDRYGSAADVRSALIPLRGTDPLPTRQAEPTEPMAAGPAPGGAAEPISPADVDPPSRPTARRWLVPATLALVALATIGVVLAISGDEDPTTPTPSEGSPLPSVGSVAGLTLDQTIQLLGNTLKDGLASGEITEKVADDVEKRSSDALEKFDRGDVEGAEAKIDEAMSKVDEAAGKGDITSSDAGLAIKEALATMKAAMVAAAEAPTPAPSPTEEGDGEEGEDD